MYRSHCDTPGTSWGSYLRDEHRHLSPRQSPHYASNKPRHHCVASGAVHNSHRQKYPTVIHLPCTDKRHLTSPPLPALRVNVNYERPLGVDILTTPGFMCVLFLSSVRNVRELFVTREALGDMVGRIIGWGARASRRPRAGCGARKEGERRAEGGSLSKAMV